jgi:hypothetical protein
VALAFRELAAPFCVAGTLIAAAQRRGRELMVWTAGAAAYGVFYAWHANAVWAQAVPESVAPASAWLQLGGVPFLLSAVRWMGFSFLLPDAALAAVLSLICAGIANPRAPTVIRAAGAAYAAFFLVIGQHFNNYWGLVAAPVWVFSSAYGVALAVDACRTLTIPAAHRGITA